MSAKSAIRVGALRIHNKKDLVFVTYSGDFVFNRKLLVFSLRLIGILGSDILRKSLQKPANVFTIPTVDSRFII